MKVTQQGRFLLGLFVLSGFSGLIYQSIWSHYLGLVLGHAAYAQALVLAIFMGGMAAGAWLASRGSVSWKHLLLRYAVLELVVGLLGLGFHPLFRGYVALSQQDVLPMLASSAVAHAYQWTSAALLILPQCVLLGMTFPLMSAAYLRLAPADDGKVLGGLYFSNSLGAALGALAAVFLLLPAVGMPGAMFTAGLLNVIVALGAWGVWKTVAENTQAPAQAVSAPASQDRAPLSLSRFLLACAFVTGATSFVYEIGWVRMLNLALGTTLHSFELMLAAFILGLACGGLWIRQRSRRIEDPLHTAGWAQVLMGVFALLSIVLLAQSFRWVEWWMKALQRNDAGYDLFLAGSAMVSLIVMFPAAFFAGMTLPLFTMGLLRAGGGEQRIGQVYASNTLGAIGGVALTVCVLIPLLGVHGAIVASALADVALGLVLLSRTTTPRHGRLLAAVSLTAVALLAAICLGRADPAMRLSGVYRTGSATLGGNPHILYEQDGRTATVAVSGWPEQKMAAISTNGKTDASLSLDLGDAPLPDEVTMIMLGLMPNLLHPAPREIAVIGWGSGLTTHTLLGSRKPALVETIEIEPAMIEGARQFGDRVARAYRDPRSKLRIDDARTHFAMGNRKYDAIVAEPSNPWVSGVASLFTHEFYGFLRGHLRSDGILVQWIQAYELDGDLLATMLAALQAEFPNSELYVTNDSDLLVVARVGPASPMDPSVFDLPPLRAELRRVGLRSPADIAMRRIGGPEVLRAYVASHAANPHSDYFPTVSLEAPRTRFKRSNAMELLAIVDMGMPIAEMLDGYRVQPYSMLAGEHFGRFDFRKNVAYAMGQRLRGDSSPPTYNGDASPLAELQALMKLSEGRIGDDDLQAWTQYVADLANDTVSLLGADEQGGVWVHPAWIDPSKQPALVQEVLAAMDAAGRRDAVQMLPTALAVLDRPAASMSGRLRDLMLVQAQLASVALHRPELVEQLERRYANTTTEQSYARRFLLAWATQTHGAVAGTATSR